MFSINFAHKKSSVFANVNSLLLNELEQQNSGYVKKLEYNFNYIEPLKKHSKDIYICQQQIRNTFYMKYGYFGFDFKGIYRYYKDAKYSVRPSLSHYILEVYNLEDDDEILKTIEKQSNAKSYICFITADNATIILVYSLETGIVLQIHDLLSNNRQEVDLKNCIFKTCWKKEYDLYILIESKESFQIYQIDLNKNKEPLLTNQRNLHPIRIDQSFSEFDDFRLFAFQDNFSQIFSKKSLKCSHSFKFSQEFEAIKMHDNGIFIVLLAAGLSSQKIIQIRQKNRLIRKFLIPRQTKCFILNNYLIIWPNRNRQIWNIIFYDIFLGWHILYMTFGEEQVSQQKIEKALLGVQNRVIEGINKNRK